MNTGSKKQNPFLRMRGMKTAGQCLIRLCHFMIRVIGRTLPGTGFRSWMKMEIRKPESEKAKGQNTFGRRSIFRPTTGITEPMRNGGERPGRSTATGILSRIRRGTLSGRTGFKGSAFASPKREKGMSGGQPGLAERAYKCGLRPHISAPLREIDTRETI